MHKYAMSLLTAVSLAAALGASGAEGVIRGNRVNVRLTPETSGVIVAQLSEPAKVTVTRANDRWVEIRPPAAYVSSRYVKDGRTTAAVNVRSGADAAAPSLGRIPAGTEVTVLNRKNEDWLEIAPPETVRAYVAASLVSTDTAGLPKLETPSVRPAPRKAASAGGSVIEARPFRDLPTVARSGREASVAGMLYPLSSDIKNIRFALLRTDNGKYVIDHFVYTGGSRKFDGFANRQVRLTGVSYQVEGWKNRVLKVSRITPVGSGTE